MKTILFVVQNLDIGGVQKAFINTANYLSSAGYEISVFAFSDGPLHSELNDSINIRYGKKLLRLMLTSIDDIKKSNRLVDLILRYCMVLVAKILGIRRLYNWLLKKEKDKKKYDIAVSYFNDVTIGFSNRGTNWYVADHTLATKKVAWIHTDPEKAGFDRKMCLQLYKTFDSIVCVSNAVREKMIKLLPEYKEKMCVVYNYYPEDIILEKANEPLNEEQFDQNKFNIITIGRIENTSKRMDRIVNICLELKRRKNRDFSWYIVGDGPDEKMIKELAIRKNLTDIIHFTGRLHNPYVLLKRANLFVLTSAYEGYPMVIGEAMLLGIPVVTTNFAASNEMIINGENGYICNMNENDLCEKIELLMKDSAQYSLIRANITKKKYVNTKWREQISLVFDR